MPFGTNESRNWTYFKLIGTKKGDKQTPYFEAKVKQGDDYVVDEEKKPTWFQAQLTKVEHGTYEHEGETNQFVKFTFDDGVDAFTWQSGFSNVAIGFINSLLGAEKLGMIHVSVYRNKDGWVTLSAREGDQKGEYLPWKFTPAQLKEKKIITQLPKGKVNVDNSELIEFLKKEIDENLSQKIDPLAPKPEAKAEEAVVEEEENGELPF